MRTRGMYRTMNINSLRGTEVGYNSVDVTSYAAFINSLTEEEKKGCRIIITSGDFDIIGVRLSCESKKDIDIFNKVVQKASNMLKIPYINSFMRDCYDNSIDEWNNEEV